MDPPAPYVVRERNGKFEVADRAGQTCFVCSDAHSAGHYANILNRAFESGYKAGYRQAKEDGGAG